jgi:hypothetical protein
MARAVAGGLGNVFGIATGFAVATGATLATVPSGGGLIRVGKLNC